MIDELLEHLKKAIAPVLSAIAAVFGYRFFFPLERPHWVGLFIVLGLIGIVVAWAFVRRLMRRGTDHYQAVPDETKGLGPDDASVPGLKRLKLIWAQAIAFLKSSHLKKWGDPLYVLPWYLVIGEKGSGKTCAVRGARLVSFAKEPRESSLTETAHCEWSFFEQAIVIDTAGRYSATTPADGDRREWMRLLDLLAKFRKKESLNGLVVTVSSQRLLSLPADALEAMGQSLRKRIDELMRALGSKFPVYVLVTKCDLVPGMVGSFSSLSDNGTQQAMGCLNHQQQADAVPFIRTAFYGLSQRLKTLRLVLAHEPDTSRLDADVLLFPDAFARLERGVSAFVRGAFQENLYQETPFLRGLYFCAVPPSTTSVSGLFLNEFFASVLPADRPLSAPTRRALEWWKKTMTMGISAWLIFTIALGGLMTYAFATNLTALREADRQFSHLPAPQGDLVADIISLDRVNHAILSLKNNDTAGWLPSFGLEESARVKKALEEKLAGWFWQELLVPFDAQNGHAMGQLTRRSSDAVFSLYVEHLIDRIELIHERLRGEALQSGIKEQAPIIPTLIVNGHDVGVEMKQAFARLYLSSVFWIPDLNDLHREEASLQGQLKSLLAVKGDAPQWVIAWAQAQNSGTPVQLTDYWGAQAASVDRQVPAIFTKKDKALIDAFFKDIEGAMNDTDIFQSLKAQYERWYRANAFDAWHRFAQDFPRGTVSLRNGDDWRRMATKVVKDDGPYFSLLNTLALELDPLGAHDAPLWISQVDQFRTLKGSQPRASLARQSLAKIGVEGDQSYTVAAVIKDYRDALQKMEAAVLDPSSVSAAVEQLMEGNAAPGTSPFVDAQAALARLKVAIDSDHAVDPAVWGLIAGPYDFLWECAQRETADQLQMQWEKNVLSAAAGVPSNDAPGVLLAPDGPAIKFAQTQAAPFVDWKPGRGYGPKESFVGHVAFTGAFFAFLNSGAKLSKVKSVTSASVSVTAAGAEVNAGAARTPSSTELTVKCGKSPMDVVSRRGHLIDKSFNVETKTVAWTPACGATTLKIDIAGILLTRTYPESHGFLDFVKEFPDGSHIFSANDFPSQAHLLAGFGIKTITVRFQISGAPQDIPDYTPASPVPLRIVRSWS